MKKLLVIGGCHFQNPTIKEVLKQYSTNMKIVIGHLTDKNIDKKLAFINANAKDNNVIFQLGNVYYLNAVDNFVPLCVQNFFSKNNGSNSKIDDNTLSDAKPKKKMVSHVLYAISYFGIIIFPLSVLRVLLFSSIQIKKINSIIEDPKNNRSLFIVLSPFYCSSFLNRMIRKIGYVFYKYKIAKKKNVIFLNCYMLLHNPTWFVDDIHLNEDGVNILLAEILNAISSAGNIFL